MPVNGYARLAAQPAIQTLDVGGAKGTMTCGELLRGEPQAQRGGALCRRDDERLTGAEGRFEMGRKFEQRDLS